MAGRHQARRTVCRLADDLVPLGLEERPGLQTEAGVVVDEEDP